MTDVVRDSLTASQHAFSFGLASLDAVPTNVARNYSAGNLTEAPDFLAPCDTLCVGCSRGDEVTPSHLKSRCQGLEDAEVGIQSTVSRNSTQHWHPGMFYDPIWRSL